MFLNILAAPMHDLAHKLGNNYNSLLWVSLNRYVFYTKFSLQAAGRNIVIFHSFWCNVIKLVV